jgi:two-component system, response regulator RegA
MTEEGRALIVDADSPSRAALVAQFERRGWEVCCCVGIADAATEADRQPVDLVVTEIRSATYSEANLLDLIEHLSRRSPPPVIVVVTAYPSIATAMSAARKGAAAYLRKPASATTILASLLGQGVSADGAHGPAQPMSLRRAEWEYLCWVLRTCNFNRSRAARILGIGRRTLQRKLETPPPVR